MQAELILYNARISTVDPAQPWAEAVACRGGRILAVGSNADILPLAGAATRRIDAAGRLVLPGLIDAHVHFLQYAILQHEISLFGLDSLAEVRQRVSQAVAGAEPGQWVLGWGWDENRWESKPTRAHLDDIAPHTPVVLRRMDMHTYWLNSAALEQAKITADTPDPPESYLERDPDGQLTGLLREWNAIELVRPYIPRPDEATLLGWLVETTAEAHRLGLTGIHDQRIEREGEQSFRLYQTLRRQNRLKLRVHLNIAPDYLPAAATLGLEPGFGDDHLWIGHLKVFADGAMGSRTAYMLEPFTDQPDNYGIAVTPPEALEQIAHQAHRAGFSLSVHAIGDRAVRETLDVLAAVPPPRLPHRIEHVQLIHPDDLPRLHRHNIVASVQPVHLCSDWPTADAAWGQRARHTYAFRSLLEQQTRLALGSDAPVAPLNPLQGIYAALTRQDLHHQPAPGWQPQEKIQLAQAIQGYTLGPAYAAGKQAVQGSISPGKWADMIMLSPNLFQLPPAEIAQAQVTMTIFNGQVVYAGEEQP